MSVESMGGYTKEARPTEHNNSGRRHTTKEQTIVEVRSTKSNDVDQSQHNLNVYICKGT
jgi:hypothetical protein